jgi:hypothetical protein
MCYGVAELIFNYTLGGGVCWDSIFPQCPIRCFMPREKIRIVHWVGEFCGREKSLAPAGN